MVERVAFARRKLLMEDEYFVSEEAMEWIALQKSQYLSKIIMNQEDQDFSFEDFMLYEHLIPSTLESPDSIYEIQDDDYPIRTFIKSYFKDIAFHQLVIGAILPQDKQEGEIFMPIISLVTKKEKMVRLFSEGKLKSAPVLS